MWTNCARVSSSFELSIISTYHRSIKRHSADFRFCFYCRRCVARWLLPSDCQERARETSRIRRVVCLSIGRTQLGPFSIRPFDASARAVSARSFDVVVAAAEIVAVMRAGPGRPALYVDRLLLLSSSRSAPPRFLSDRRPPRITMDRPYGTRIAAARIPSGSSKRWWPPRVGRWWTGDARWSGKATPRYSGDDITACRISSMILGGEWLIAPMIGLSHRL